MTLKYLSMAASCGLFLWAMFQPDSYGPPALLGLAVGDFIATFWFGVTQGYLEENAEFRLSDFTLSFICFAALTILVWRNASFVAGSDEYTTAILAGALAGALSFLVRLGGLTWNSLR